jgi:hypothetical protein
MKHPVEHLRFPESTVEGVTEFRQVTGQVLWTDAMMHTTNIALDIGDQRGGKSLLPRQEVVCACHLRFSAGAPLSGGDGQGFIGRHPTRISGPAQKIHF